MIHTIKLSGYKASPGFLQFGTAGSYGIEQMQFVLGDDWKDFAIKATFTNPQKKSKEVHVPADTLLIDVPPEATAGESGTGQIAVVGYADGVQVISTKILYGLDDHAPIEGSPPAEPTPSLLQQVLTATGNAETSAAAAKDAAEQAKSSASAAAASAGAAISVVKPFAETAETAATEAVSAAKAATDAKVAAAASADDAAVAAVAAGNAASAAAESAQAALESKTAAATSEKNAAASAKQAKDIADSLHADYTTALNEIAALKTNKADKTELETVKQQVESITPDDSTIGEKPWSSKNIIDMLCPKIEESGNPVQCYPVSGYPLGVKAKWKPMQEGSGTPSPENIRPIKGRDSVTVTRQENNQVIALTLPETIYGGEVDAVSGEGKQTWKLLTLDGTENWVTAGSGDTLYFRSALISIGNRSMSGNDYCTTFPISQISGSNTVQGLNGWNTSLYLRWPTFADVDALKAYLAAQYAAGTPVQVCYKLATPAPFTATGGAALPALAGANTVITDADFVDVTGRADPIKRIEDLEAAVASIN